MNSDLPFLNSLLGLDLAPNKLTFAHVALRGVLVFLAALIMLRLGDRRFLSKRSAFDAVLGFILASMLARAVNGTASFFPTLAGGFVVVGLHRLLAFLTRNCHWLGNLIKGKAELVVDNGRIHEHALKTHDLSEHDLLEDLRMNGNVQDLSRVRAAYFERNGGISVVKD